MQQKGLLVLIILSCATGTNIDGLTIKYWKLLSGIFGCGIIRVDVVK